MVSQTNKRDKHDIKTLWTQTMRSYVLNYVQKQYAQCMIESPLSRHIADDKDIFSQGLGAFFRLSVILSLP